MRAIKIVKLNNKHSKKRTALLKTSKLSIYNY